MKPIHITLNTPTDFTFYLDDTLRKVTVPISVFLSKSWKSNGFKDKEEGLRYFSRCNAHQRKLRMSRISNSNNKDVVLITIGPGEALHIPECVDLTLDKLFFHMKDGSISGVDYQILLLE